MAKAPALSDVTNILTSATVINSNHDAIQASFQNTLSLDGSTPNAMLADLDLNSNDVINVGRVAAQSITIQGQLITSVATVPQWRGAWANATSYAVNDLVRQSGTTYICLVAHTSMVFVDELNEGKWTIFAQKGSPGDGTGDMLAENNLSEVDPILARANLSAQEFSAALQLIANAGITAISGNDLTLVSGTAGTNGNLAEWNVDGDLVDGPEIIDDDTMATATSSNIATSESVKAYVDRRTTASNVTVSRAFNTLYTNTSGTTRTVYITVSLGNASVSVVLNGVSVATLRTPSGAGIFNLSYCFDVPVGHTYQVNQEVGAPLLLAWLER